MNETIVDIIEAFEDFLDEKGIAVPNDDKERAIADGEDPASICNIYGMDFGDLYYTIDEILKQNETKREENRHG